MESTREFISVAETAKMIRAALKHNFPTTKFTVRSKSYSGGASVDVAWENGPRTAEVSAVAKRFEGASFDAMQDLKEYHDTVLVNADGSPRRVHFGADYIFCTRTTGIEVKQAVVSAVAKLFGRELPAYGNTGYPNDRDLINFYSVEQAIDLRTNTVGAFQCSEPGDSFHSSMQAALLQFLPKV